MKRGRVGRLFVMPAVILIVAWGLTTMTRQRDARDLATLERAVGAWCQAAARGEDPPVPVAPELPRDRVVEALRSACRSGDAEAAWSVAVAKGPGTAPSGRATHHAVVRVDGVDHVGLLLGLRDGQAVVTGYWLPR